MVLGLFITLGVIYSITFFKNRFGLYFGNEISIFLVIVAVTPLLIGVSISADNIEEYKKKK